MAPAPPLSLLLLPANRSVLHADYRVPLTAVLTRLSRESAPGPGSGSGSGSGPCVLVVSVAAPVLADEAEAKARRPVRWKAAQALLAHVYSVIASVCAAHAIPTDVGADEPGSVDARVVLIDRHPDSASDSASASASVVLDLAALAALAAMARPWRTVFLVANEPGNELLAAYLRLAEDRQELPQSQIVAVDAGPSFSGQDVQDIQEDAIDGYSTVCLGGTFDHLHPGHKLLLHAAALLLRIPQDGQPCCTLIVGISDDELLAGKRYAAELQPWHTRARSVVDLLSTVLGAPTTAAPSVTSSPSSGKAELRTAFRDGAVLVRCVDIRDPFGPTVAEEAIDAIVVSAETRAGADAINRKRADRAWPTLDIYEIDVLDASLDVLDASPDADGPGRSFASKISSTEIRRHKAELRRRQQSCASP